MPEISVIIPVYNVQSYLNRCIKSVVQQTFQDIEIILVDDGSMDDCPRLCDEWRMNDKRIKVIHKKNGGLSSARNAGLQEATGTYISFIDSDDWIEENMLGDLYALLQQYPKADIAQCAILYDNGKKKVVQPEKKICIYSQQEMWESFFRIHGEDSNTSVCTRLYRKKILKDFSFVITLNEDVEASYEFCLRCQTMVESNQIGYHYFFNNNSITHSPFSKRDLEYFQVWDRIVDKTKRDHPEYLYFATMGRKRANFTMYIKMLTCGYCKDDNELKQIKKKLKEEIRSDFTSLIKWKMPLSRKVVLILICLYPF